MSDLDAIREDVAMAARSPEMARHVALDHAPELLDEIERLRAVIEDRDDALMQAGRDNLDRGQVIARVKALADTYGYTPNMTSAHHEIADQITRAIDGAPDPRRVETAEELDALPLRAVVVEEPHGHVWIRHSDKWHCSCDGTGVEWSSAEVFGDLGCGEQPLTVLWLPEGES